MSKEKTSIVFTGDIGFDRYMDHRWEDDELLSKPILDFFYGAHLSLPWVFYQPSQTLIALSMWCRSRGKAYQG